MATSVWPVSLDIMQQASMPASEIAAAIIQMETLEQPKYNVVAAGAQAAAGTLTPVFGAAEVYTFTFGAGNLTIANPVAAQPSVAPTLSAVAGNLPAGSYTIGYTFSTAAGESTISPTSVQVVAAGQSIQIAAITGIPANVTLVKFYFTAVPAGATGFFTSLVPGGQALGPVTAPGGGVGPIYGLPPAVAGATPVIILGSTQNVGNGVAAPGANATGNPPNPGRRLTFYSTQDGVGGRTLAFGALFKRIGGALVLSAGAGAVDTFGFLWNGTNWMQVAAPGLALA